MLQQVWCDAGWRGGSYEIGHVEHAAKPAAWRAAQRLIGRIAQIEDAGDTKPAGHFNCRMPEAEWAESGPDQIGLVLLPERDSHARGIPAPARVGVETQG